MSEENAPKSKAKRSKLLNKDEMDTKSKIVNKRGRTPWKVTINMNNGRYFPQQYITYLRRKSKNRRDGKDLIFTLTVKQLDALYEKQNCLCYYTGRTLTLPVVGRPWTHAGWNVSVDRINSLKGYTLNNIVLCIGDANLAKQSMSHNDFITLCKDISNTHPC